MTTPPQEDLETLVDDGRRTTPDEAEAGDVSGDGGENDARDERGGGTGRSAEPDRPDAADEAESVEDEGPDEAGGGGDADEADAEDAGTSASSGGDADVDPQGDRCDVAEEPGSAQSAEDSEEAEEEPGSPSESSDPSEPPESEDCEGGEDPAREAEATEADEPGQRDAAEEDGTPAEANGPEPTDEPETDAPAAAGETGESGETAPSDAGDEAEPTDEPAEAEPTEDPEENGEGDSESSDELSDEPCDDDADGGSEVTGADGDGATGSTELPPSYPPKRRPTPLPVPGRKEEERSLRARRGGLVTALLLSPFVKSAQRRRGWLSTIAVVLVVIAMAAFVKTYIVQTFEIPSGSMENTLMTDDRVSVRMYHAHDVHRGDVVVFSDPADWLDVEDPGGLRGAVRDGLMLIRLLPENSGHHLIKRVVGVAGDHVTADGTGAVSVNGVPVNETYLKDGVAPSTVPFDIVVPEGCVWVMGDNRSNSLDSRFHRDDPHGGAVPLDNVVGVATRVVWPLDRWTSLEEGEQVFNDVPGDVR